MGHKNEGVVVEFRGDYTVVKPTSLIVSDEGEAQGMQGMNVEMHNHADAKVGDRVRFDADESNMIKAIFVVYMLPLILIAVGAVVGNQLSYKFNLNSTALSVAGAIVFFGFAAVIIKLYDGYAKNSPKMKPIIVEVLDTAEEMAKKPKEISVKNKCSSGG